VASFRERDMSMAVLQTVKVHEKTRRMLLTLTEEDGAVRTLFVTHDAYVRAGSPARGESIGEDTLRELCREDARVRAFRHALYLLSFADNSRAQLLRKLRSKGYSSEAAAFAVDEAVRLGYVRESEQLARYVRVLANERLYGRRRIVAALASKGYRTADITATVDALCESGCIDFQENFARLCEKKGDGSDESRAKLRYTYGYGGGTSC